MLVIKHMITNKNADKDHSKLNQNMNTLEQACKFAVANLASVKLSLGMDELICSLEAINHPKKPSD